MRLLLAFAALLTIGAAPVDWTRTVERAPSGAYVIGNPKAKVRVVEYMSYTCPHCGHFATLEIPKLMAAFVRPGLASFEIRNAVRDRLDFAASLAARCSGPVRFPGHHDAIFNEQKGLFERAAAFDQAHGAATANDPNAGLKALARGSGLTLLMSKRGVTPAALDVCLTSPAAQAPVLAMTQEAWQDRKIPGTPYFLVNNVATKAATFGDLEAPIRAAAQR